MSTLISLNPAKNFAINGQVPISSKQEIKQKVQKAKKAFLSWKSTDIAVRKKLLRKIFYAFLKHSNELSKLITTEIGKPISQSRQDIAGSLYYFDWYLKNAEKFLEPEITFEDRKSIHKVYFEPIGVAAVILPWNFPFNIFIWGVIQNLIVGNTVVVKPSEECPLFAKKIEEIITKTSLPEGVFNQIYGTGVEGDFLVNQEINLIYFTGSTKVGKYLYKVAAKKFIKAVLEMGGSAPGIVFEDADINRVVSGVYDNRFENCGQMCDALKRLIVHESRFDEVIQKLKKTIEAKKVGDPEKIFTDIGPLVNKNQLKLLELQVEDARKKGAKVITGGQIPKDFKGAFYLPTLLTNIKPTMKVWQEEVFGPVLPVISFKTEDQAIKLANDTNYGLGGYIFTKDKKRALRVARKIDSGAISVNNLSYFKPQNPFGGFKDSGFGREHGKYGFYELTQPKVITMGK